MLVIFGKLPTSEEILGLLLSNNDRTSSVWCNKLPRRSQHHKKLHVVLRRNSPVCSIMFILGGRRPPNIIVPTAQFRRLHAGRLRAHQMPQKRPLVLQIVPVVHVVHLPVDGADQRLALRRVSDEKNSARAMSSGKPETLRSHEDFYAKNIIIAPAPTSRPGSIVLLVAIALSHWSCCSPRPPPSPMIFRRKNYA